jgi:hypothetical protein
MALISSTLAYVGRARRQHLLEHAGALAEFFRQANEIGKELLFAGNQTETGHVTSLRSLLGPADRSRFNLDFTGM